MMDKNNTHMKNLLPQGGGLHTADEAKQQVHHGRGINMFQHQTDEPFLSPQKGNHLQKQTYLCYMSHDFMCVLFLFFFLQAVTPHLYLLCFPGYQIADGFAEEAGQQRIQGRVLFQEVVEHLEKRLVPTQLIIYNGHI